jgi:hypothetical protein
MKTKQNRSEKSLTINPDAPVPFRIRVDSPSAELRAFVVPAGAQRFSTEPPAEEKSGVRLKVA